MILTACVSDSLEWSCIDCIACCCCWPGKTNCIHFCPASRCRKLGRCQEQQKAHGGQVWRKVSNLTFKIYKDHFHLFKSPYFHFLTLNTLINRAIRPSNYIFRKSIICPLSLYSSTESVWINFTQLITLHLSEEIIFIICVCSPVKRYRYRRYRYLKH